MKIFDSLKTLNKYHDIYKTLSESQQNEFAFQVDTLFDMKSVSEEGAFENYKITEKELLHIQSKLV